MQDYIPQDPNRKKMTHGDGTIEYVHIESADNPMANNPTPLNKATLLDDNTCAILNIPATATPNDALQKILLPDGKRAFAITVQYEDGTPAEGITVSGITKLNGGAAVTDEKGYTLGIATTASASLSISTPYLDINSWSQTVTSTKPVTNVTAVLTKKTATNVQQLSSTSFRFSRFVSGFDVTLVGGGGGGGKNWYNRNTGNNTGGGGGGGGYVSVQSIASVSPNDIFSAEIGSGGTGGENPTGGGTSTFKKNGTELLSASGGESGGEIAVGGNGNGRGGDGGIGNGSGGPGGDGSGGYGGGGGGGGGVVSDSRRSSGGSPCGGSGGSGFSNNVAQRRYPALTGNGPGGGGGGAYSESNSNDSLGADGYSGAAVISWRYKA